MSEERKVLILGFEIPYSDGSATEYAVRYDSAKNYLSRPGGIIEFESAGEPMQFPADRLDWLIESLQRISAEINA